MFYAILFGIGTLSANEKAIIDRLRLLIYEFTGFIFTKTCVNKNYKYTIHVRMYDMKADTRWAVKELHTCDYNYWI